MGWRTTFILAQRKRGVSALEQMIRDVKTTWKEGQQELNLREGCKPRESCAVGFLPRSGLVQPTLSELQPDGQKTQRKGLVNLNPEMCV